MAEVKFGPVGCDCHFLSRVLIPSGGQISSLAVPLILTLRPG